MADPAPIFSSETVGKAKATGLKKREKINNRDRDFLIKLSMVASSIQCCQYLLLEATQLPWNKEFFRPEVLRAPSFPGVAVWEEYSRAPGRAFSLFKTSVTYGLQKSKSNFEEFELFCFREGIPGFSPGGSTPKKKSEVVNFGINIVLAKGGKELRNSGIMSYRLDIAGRVKENISDWTLLQKIKFTHPPITPHSRAARYCKQSKS